MILPAHERVSILVQRLANLHAGAGDYDNANRTLAIKNAREALERAVKDWGRAN